MPRCHGKYLNSEKIENMFHVQIQTVNYFYFEHYNLYNPTRLNGMGNVKSTQPVRAGRRSIFSFEIKVSFSTFTKEN